MKENELKTYARAAKERLRSGYWNDRYERKNEKNEKLESADDLLKDYYKASKLEKRKKSEKELEEDRLYPIVCSIIDEDDGLNPLGRLIDKRYYESLDFEGKQRYVFELSEKYRRLKQRYYEEREIERKLKMLAKLQ